MGETATLLTKVQAMANTQTAKRGQNPKFSAKEQALVNEANAKAEAKGATIQGRGPKRGDTVKTTVVPAAAAAHATEKAPHTKRALQQNAAATKLAKAEARVAAAQQAVDAAHKVATKVPRSNMEERTAKFLVKAKAEQELIAARKALRVLKHEALTPEERAAKAPKQSTPRKAPAAKATQTYKVVSTDHGARPDSKRAKQLLIVFAHTDTVAAKAAGAESVDFAFAVAKGFIKYT